MLSSLTPKQSRMLAVALLLLLVILILSLVIYPVWSMSRGYDKQIEDTQFQIQRLQRIAIQNDRYQLEFNNLKRGQRSDKRYLQSKTDSLANAELQRRIKQVVAAGKGEIISTQTVKLSQDAKLNRVAIRVRMKATLENLKKILHQLETQQPYLFIDNLTLRSRNLARRRLPSKQKITDAIKMLDLDFLLVGYIKSGDS
ncbi:MAG: type II secretion system protein GspM [Candidatus Thiodiazotropha sp.]